MRSKKPGVLYRAAILFVVMFCLSECGLAQNHQSEMSKANEALGKKDYAAYLQHMKKAVGLGPDRSGRPYYQYGLARAYAYNRQIDEALTTLGLILSEQIEAPMAFLAELDPAFITFREDSRLQKFLARRREMPISFRQIAGNVYQIDGAGCNLAASIGKDEIFLVDSGYPQLSLNIKSALAKQNPGKSVRWIVNTHEHYDHVGGNAAIGPDAIVIAHTKARTAMQKPSEFFSDFPQAAFPEADWPDFTFENEISIHFNDEEIRIIALPAHTEGDAIVYFTKSGVLHMGDNYFPGTSKFIYPGAEIRNFFETFGPFLSSLPADVKVMSGHAAPVPATDLKHLFQKTERMYSFVLKGIEDKTKLEELKAAAEVQGFPSDWVEFFHKKLSQNESSN